MDLEKLATDVAFFTRNEAYLNKTIHSFNQYIISRPFKDSKHEKVFLQKIHKSLYSAQELALKYSSLDFFKIGVEGMNQSLNKIDERYQNEFKHYINISE